MKIPIFKPHLIVLDVVMPELDGVEMCRSVKSSDAFRDTKVLLISGYPEDERLQKALLAGADDWIAKPVTARPFIEKVAAMLGVHGPSGPSEGRRMKDGFMTPFSMRRCPKDRGGKERWRSGGSRTGV